MPASSGTFNRIYLVAWRPEQWPGNTHAEMAEFIATTMPNVAGVCCKAVRGTDWQGGPDPKALHGPDDLAEMVQAFAQHNLDVHVWGVPRGLQAGDIPEEANRWQEAGNVPGVRSLLLDIEFGQSYWQGNQNQAELLLNSIRSNIPTNLPLCAIMDARNAHINHFANMFPPSNFDRLHPMVYPILFGNFQSIDAHMEEAFNNLAPFGKPIMPMLQAFCDVGGRPTPAQISEQATAAWNRGATAISFFRLGIDHCSQDNLPHMGDPEYAAIAALEVPDTDPDPPILQPGIYIDPNNPNDPDPLEDPDNFIFTGHSMTMQSELVLANVSLYRQGIRERVLVAESITNTNGRFTFLFPRSLAAAPGTAFVLEATAQASGEVTTSPLICDFEPVMIIDLLFGEGEFRGPPEYALLERQMRSILTAEGLHAADLTEEDIENIVCIYKLDREQVAFYAIAARLFLETTLSRPGLYGMYREGLPTDLFALVSQSRQRQEAALNSAIAKNIIGFHMEETAVSTILDRLQELIVELALREPEPDQPSFASLFELASVNPDHRQRILQDYITREGSVAEYWEALRADPTLSNDELDNLAETLKISTVAVNHLPLVQQIRELQNQGELGPNTRDLCQLKEADWLAILETEVNGVPVGAPVFLGADEAERNGRFAQLLPRMMTRFFPTAMFTTELTEINGNGTPIDYEGTLAILNAHPELNLRGLDVQAFFDEHPDTLNGLADPEGTVTQFKKIISLEHLVPEFQKALAIDAMLQNGDDSASKIRRIGAASFMRKYKGILGEAEASKTYASAARIADTALLLASQSVAFNPTFPGIIAPHLFGQGIPALEDLFGSLDLCQCEHCSSVYSPAAYFVDILHWLMNRDAKTPGRTALDVLMDPNRRWDLGEVELNCHNTNTVMPYVDLVLEILEAAVVNGGTLPQPPADQDDPDDVLFPFQTHTDSDELGANPEHLNTDAYTIVSAAVYPWNLPFQLSLEEARIYLENMGVQRHELMSQFNVAENLEATVAAAAEYLGLAAVESNMIANPDSAPLFTLWGFDDQIELEQFIETHNVTAFLDRSDVAYDDLVQLLNVAFINPFAAVQVEFATADCHLDTAVLTDLDTDFLSRFHRFVRLWRALDWTIPEINAILGVISENDISSETIIELATIKQLEKELKTKLPTLLSWWSEQLDTNGIGDEKSLYAEIFLDATVHQPALDVFALNSAQDELDEETHSLLDHVPIVYSALGISANDLTLLIDTILPDDGLNLANLTRLYQVVSLAKACRWSISEFLSLGFLYWVNPFTVGEVSHTDLFVKFVMKVKASPFTIGELDYLFRDEMQSSPPAGSTIEEIAALLAELRAGLLQIKIDHQLPASPDEKLKMADEKLALVMSPEFVSHLSGLIQDPEAEPIPEAAIEKERSTNEHLTFFNNLVDSLSQLTDLPLDSALDEPLERAEFLLTPLLAYLSQLAGENLVVQTISSALDIEPLVGEALLKQWVTIPDGGDVSMSVFLAEPFSPELPEETDDDQDPPDLLLTTTPDAFPVQFATYRRLRKVGLILERWGFEYEQLAFLFTHGADIGWLNLNGLPVEPTAATMANVEAWEVMNEALSGAVAHFRSVTPLITLLTLLNTEGVTVDAFLSETAVVTGWERTDIEFLSGAELLNLQFPDDYQDGTFLAKMVPFFTMLQKLGVSAAVAHQWAEADVASEMAQEIKQAARARYASKEQWLEVAKDLRDGLREQQRAALVAYLVHEIRVQIHPVPAELREVLNVGDTGASVRELQYRLNVAGAMPPLRVDGIYGPLTRTAVLAFKAVNGLPNNPIIGMPAWDALSEIQMRLSGPEDLYAHFLIDVEMDPCMLTSRLVQATQAVQLFIQRCLLNLEPEVYLASEDAKEWTGWMERYRVWEANRKIFLYPENWIEPELRYNKTPFFKELESGLLQDEINDLTVEREYLKYLNALNQVARLDIVGIFREREEDSETLHVIGRTYNQPHLYFYRQNINGRYWTAWERVDVDIEGDHLIPVIWNRRLYLFWPMFMEKAAEEIPTDNSNDETSEKRPKRYYEIRLAWAEYRNGQWLPKNVSNEFIESYRRDNKTRTILPTKDRFAFWPQIDESNNLYIVFEERRRKEGPYNYNYMVEKFRLISCDGKISISTMAIYHKEMVPFPNAEQYFNFMRQQENQDKFAAITDGTNIFIDTPDKIEYLSALSSDVQVLLGRTPGRFKIVFPSKARIFKSLSAFFYADNKRTFFVTPEQSEKASFANSFNGEVQLGIADSLTKTMVSYISSIQAEMVTGTNSAILPMVDSPFNKVFEFEHHYHPYVCLLIEQLNRHGIEGVLKPDPQKASSTRQNLVRSLNRQQRRIGYFSSAYDPESQGVVGPGRERFEFHFSGAYSIYNWELFFHAPSMIAKRLSDNQRFAEAHKWYSYIFNPTYRPTNEADEPWPERVWQIQPFYEAGAGESLQSMMLLLGSQNLTNRQKKTRNSLRNQIEEWRKDPFNPHLIASMRWQAYMKATVIDYLDNLIAWADHLFRQDTRESINQATQLYVMAAELLGERPKEIPLPTGGEKVIDGEVVSTFNDLRPHLDEFSNALIDLEIMIDPKIGENGDGGNISSLIPSNTFQAPGVDDDPDFGFVAPHVDPPPDNPSPIDNTLATPVPAILGPTLFFCIPKNDKLLEYWDVVADRLFKIRHCMNIEGVVRQLALFDPPIDPALLVKAAAAGVDIGSVLNNLNAPPPHYRFQTLAQKANEFINDVKSFGGALLSAIEKRDAEEIALIRASQEVKIAIQIRQIKEQTIEEAIENLEALSISSEVIKARQSHYTKLIEAGLSKKEEKHLERLEKAYILNAVGQGLKLLAGGLALFPDVDIGIAGAFSTPVIKIKHGGEKIAQVANFGIGALEFFASMETYLANKASIQAGYDRRKQDWEYQKRLAAKELEQIEQQLVAAEIRKNIAESDLNAHNIQIENAKQNEAFLANKFTNSELYHWMTSQISAVYFQSYQLAYDLAKQAERAFQHELGINDSNYIQFGYWDSLKKGLLSGEKLGHDLRRLEAAYLQENRREFELAKHFSLTLLNPLALIALKEEAACEFVLPEELFDLDFPGHYFRRIKSVSLTIPAVTGPYTSISCTLRLLKSSIRRKSTLLGGQYARDIENEDNRFSDSFGPIQSIATSNGQNDSGLFQLDFRDERFLPFEKCGVISRWELSLPNEFRQFDYKSIKDVVVTINYTAREGGEGLKNAAVIHLEEQINQLVTGEQAPGLYQAVDMSHHFPTEWHRFLHPAAEQTGNVMTLQISEEMFPYMLRDRTLQINNLDLFVKLGEGFTVSDLGTTTLTLNHDGGDVPIELDEGESIGEQLHMAIPLGNGIPIGEWTMQLSDIPSDLMNDSGNLNSDVLENMTLVLHYTAELV